MKFFRYLTISALFLFLMVSCKKSSENQWKIEITNPAKEVKVTDISKEFYDTKVPLETFKQKYPWFQGTVPDEDYSERRLDSAEVKIYKEAISKIDVSKLNKELTDLYSHVKYYFNDFPEPQVFL